MSMSPRAEVRGDMTDRAGGYLGAHILLCSGGVLGGGLGRGSGRRKRHPARLHHGALLLHWLCPPPSGQNVNL